MHLLASELPGYSVTC